MRKEIILIRHGECRTNKSQVFQTGNQYETDPLTEKGVSMARDLAQRFGNIAVDKIVTSSYLRARQTAQLLNETINTEVEVPVIENSKIIDLLLSHENLGSRQSLLREIDNPHQLGGLRFADPKAAEIQAEMKSHELDTDWHFSNEENLGDLWQRAEMITEYLESRKEKTIVVVAHGGILKVWLAHLMFKHDESLSLEHKLAAYRGFTKLGWYDNTGVVSLFHKPGEGWQWPLADIRHLHPKYFNFMPQHDEEQAVDEREDSGTYLE